MTTSVEQLYTHLHVYPELSRKEEQTAKWLAAELCQLGFEVTEKVGGHGVVAVLKNGDGKTLLLRCEMDALPVKEETGAAYASVATSVDPAGKVAPAMHACGHDVNIACLVETARVMVALKDQWRGTC